MKKLQQKIHQTAVEKGFWPSKEQSVIPEKLMLVVSELSEALEEYRKPNVDISKPYFEEGKEKPEGFGPEIADAIIRILDLCEAFGLDAEELINQKMNYNNTRSFRHGNKRA